MPTTPRAVRHRRAVGLIAMTVVVPGSAQYVAGSRRLGLWVIRAWLGLLAAILLVVLGLFVVRGPTLALLLWGPLTGFMKVAVWVLFAGWLVLLVDAWRLSRPPELSRGFRLGLTAACVSLAIIGALGSNLVASAFVAAGHVGDVFEGGGNSETQHGRYNILLLGVDAAADRQGLRPDSINVASIDAQSGRTVIFGLPRNLMGVPFPVSSPLYSQYPAGYRCGDDCMLNGIYTLGMDNAELYPGKDAGLEATKEVVQETLGLTINYYAMVDLAGFQSLVDAMGGIRLHIGKRVPIGGGSSEISEWIEAGENVHLDGYDALWYARSRADSDDYERMIRQKCVLRAMAKQLDPGTLASRFVELAEAGSHVVRTDVSTDKIAELVELAIKGKDLPIETLNFSPPLIDTGSPDFDLIRQNVAASIAASQALDAPQPTTPAARDASSAPAAEPPAEAGNEEPSPEAAETTEVPICTVP